MPKPVNLAFALLLPALASALAAAPTIYIAYPGADHRVSADHIILEGSVTPGAALTISGKAVKVGPDGLFMEWWPLHTGLNDLKLVASSAGQTGTARIKITRLVQSPLPAKPTIIDRKSVAPAADVEFWDIAADTPAERRLEVSFRGSPGGRATAQIAGQPAQAMTEGLAGIYTAVLTVPPSSAKNTTIGVRLTGRDGKTATASAAGRLSVATGLPRTGVQKAGTIQGQGLNDAGNSVTDAAGNPVLYPRNGMTFTLVGKQGPDVRARLASGQSVLISASQLNILPGAPALAQAGTLSSNSKSTLRPGGLLKATAPQTPPPAKLPVASTTELPSSPTGAVASPASAETVPATPVPAADPAVIPATPGGADAPAAASGFTPVVPPPLAPLPNTPASTVTGDWQLRVPLGGAKVPFTINQTGPGQLTLNLYGLSVAPGVPLLDDFLKGVRREGASLTLDFATPQLWGFTANYDGPDLLLTVRRPPALSAAQPLLGRTITIDPGHGGSQNGGAGSLRVPEKDIVLPIALRVAQLLQQQGATINMTRTSDITLGLYERDLMAEAAHSDLLVSIHANALPDGHDPRGIRGPEVHFTHEQARNVSAAILAQLRSRLPELGAGKGLMPGANLALTRPTTQISLLVETAYLTDAGNLRVLMSPEGRERFAQAIAGGIIDFYRAQPAK